MEFSVVIPLWNDLEYIKLCYKSLLNCSAYDHEILFHVDGSTDGTVEWLKENHIPFSYSNVNEGICTATNKAAKRATKNYIFFANSDMVFLPGWDLELAKYLTDTPLILTSNLIEPTGKDPRFIITNNYGIKLEDFNLENLLNDISEYRSGVVEYGWNYPFLVSAWVWKTIGGLDERLNPGYCSDPDFFLTVYEKFGLSPIRIRDSILFHFSRISTSKIGDQTAGARCYKTFKDKWKGKYWFIKPKAKYLPLKESRISNHIIDKCVYRIIRSISKSK